MPSRNNVFDSNRNMAENNERDTSDQLEVVIRRQEAMISELTQQVQHLQHQIQMQQVQQQMVQQPQHDVMNQFLMQPRDIIEQFRRIKPLDGKHNPVAFVKSVDSTFNLCGQNESLRRYALDIIINEKIIGDVAQRLGDLDNLSWNDVKQKISQHLKPRKSYAEIFNYCRYIKVSNLEELFSIFEKSKYEICQIYAFDPLKPPIYKSENVDRDLVDIMMEKIDGTVRAHINDKESLQDIIMKYTKLKLLTDKRTIDYRHRKASKDEKESGKFHTVNNDKGNYRDSKSKNLYYKVDNSNNDTNTNRTNYRNKATEGTSNQTRYSHMSVDQQQNLGHVPSHDSMMDISNVEEDYVNFLTMPPNPDCP